MEEWISLTTVQDVTPKVLTCIIHRYFIGFLRLLPTTESIPPCQIFEHSAFAFPGIQNAIATFIRVYGSLSSYKLITNLKREPFTRRCFRKGLLISVGRRASTLPTFPESSAYHSAAYRPKYSAYLHRRAELHHVLPI